MPANASEGERLEFQHHLLIRTFGLHQSPLPKGKTIRVLDLGCGTGNWAIDFAKHNQHAQVFGYDVNDYPIWKEAPPNCELHIVDIESDELWASFSERFDYIHGRLIVVGVRDWPRLLRQCHEHLAPGGWFEIQDLKMPTECMDKSVGPATSKFVEYGMIFKENMPKVGLDPDLTAKIPKLLSNAGFSNVEVQSYKMFTGPWLDDEEEKELGKMGQANLIMGMYGFTHKLCTGLLGWSEERYGKWIKDTEEEILEGKFQTYLPLTVCFAQHS